jgi:hypothetical protein
VERPIYTETSYYLPTTSVLPTTFYPTSAIYPTVLDYPMVASSATICCNESVPARSAIATEPLPETSSRLPAIRSPAPRQAPAPVIESQPAAAAEENANDRTASGELPPNPTPPTAPAAPAERTTAPPATKPPGPAPADSDSILVPPVPTPGAPEEAVKRDSLKPVGLSPILSPRNVLEGRVVSSESGRAEGNVRVTASSRSQAFVDRYDLTDASGHYAIRVPDGDWTVKVTMPSGRTYDVYQLTVSGAQVTDDRGEAVSSLTITR